MAWIILFFAGLLEVGWAIGLKHTDGLTRLPILSAVTALTMLASVMLLGYAMKTLPVGTAYAVWTGIGSVGTVLIGILAFGDSASPGRIFCISLIVLGILGVKFID